MNLTQRKIEKKAASYAKQLLKRAQKHEPQITKDLQNIASEVSAEMVGLEDRFKTEESLTRKIAEGSVKNVRKFFESGYSLENAIEKAVKMRAERNNDTLRYTFIFSFEKYVFGFKQSLQKLKQNGFKVPEDKIWNAWKNIGTIFDKGYRGINITIISSQGQVFELQFHTRSSHKLKTETHVLYEELRGLKNSHERENEIIQELVKMAETVRVPKGVKTL